MMEDTPPISAEEIAEQKRHFFEMASQYYERFLNGKSDPADAVIKIRYYILRAKPEYTLADLEPNTHPDERKRVEAEINKRFEKALGNFPPNEKAILLREALENYALLTSGHDCDVIKTIQRIRIDVSNADATFSALEPDVPETRKEDVEREIETYFERAEALATDSSNKFRGNDISKNPPPFFGTLEEKQHAQRLEKATPPSSQRGGGGR